MIEVGSVVIDVADVRRAARFWCALLGYVPRDGEADDFMVLTDPRRPWANVSMQRNPEPKREVNRVHLDLYTRDRAAEVLRIEALGGRRIPWEYDADADYVVMCDPDGNEFCVVQRP